MSNIDQKLKNLQKKQRAIDSQIASLKKQIKESQSQQPVISWRTIVFQQRISVAVWNWASLYSNENGTIQDIEDLVRDIGKKNPSNKKKSERSLAEIEKLKQIPLEEAIKKARAYLNNSRMSKKGW